MGIPHLLRLQTYLVMPRSYFLLIIPPHYRKEWPAPLVLDAELLIRLLVQVSTNRNLLLYVEACFHMHKPSSFYI